MAHVNAPQLLWHTPYAHVSRDAGRERIQSDVVDSDEILSVVQHIDEAEGEDAKHVDGE